MTFDWQYLKIPEIMTLAPAKDFFFSSSGRTADIRAKTVSMHHIQINEICVYDRGLVLRRRTCSVLRTVLSVGAMHIQINIPYHVAACWIAPNPSLPCDDIGRCVRGGVGDFGL